MSHRKGDHELRWHVHNGERYLRATDVVGICLTLEEDLHGEPGAEYLWLLAQIFGVFLASDPSAAYQQLRE